MTEACMCSAVGDPHYTQYDAAGCKNCKLHFQGPCMYVLTERDVAEKPECNFK
ncbi:hypothetical protein DPMN_054580 [Dreissena polymorpha]|uniref:Uncharacterized protein n=1 Tax=Dreissena polymorpha TaxID=45954 RepID=A0A9D4HRQ0_DREPO|nr:hypothetical protein DPMN_054580 [Dreissena polymorpha]